MTTHSSFLAWRIPWTENPGGLQSWVLKESDITKRLSSSNSILEVKKKLMMAWIKLVTVELDKGDGLKRQKVKLPRLSDLLE